MTDSTAVCACQCWDGSRAEQTVNVNHLHQLLGSLLSGLNCIAASAMQLVGGGSVAASECNVQWRLLRVVNREWVCTCRHAVTVGANTSIKLLEIPLCHGKRDKVHTVNNSRPQ